MEKKVHYQFSGVDEDSKEIVTTYKMVNDTLKIVNVEEIPIKDYTNNIDVVCFIIEKEE